MINTLRPLKTIENVPGFVINYLLCGPFNKNCTLTSCKAFKKNYLNASGKENNCRPQAGIIEYDSDGTQRLWTPYVVRHGIIVNLIALFSGQAMVNYAAAYIFSPQKKRAVIGIGSDDGFKLYLNNKFVGQNHIHRGLGIDSDKLEVQLKKGVNFILLKIEHNFGGHEFCMRITDKNGKGIKGIRSLLDHPDVKLPLDPAKQRSVFSYDYLVHKFAISHPSITFSGKTVSDFRSWRNKFLKQVKKLLGPQIKPCPLKPETVEETVSKTFCRKKVLIDFEPGYSIPCYVTVPLNLKRNEKRPAILCLHGHGKGKADMAGISIGTEHESTWSKSYAIALHAASAGYVTISPDFMAFGERLGPGAPFGIGQDPCNSQFAWAQAIGLVPTGLNIHTVSRCIDYLETLDFVDKNRIGAIGHSFGGYMTAMATAFESRIKCAVMSGFICSAAAYHGKPWDCGSQVVPGFFAAGDLTDIVCTIAPRPTLIISGLYDCVTPFPFVKTAYKKIQKPYKLLGATRNLHHFTFPGEHLFQPEPAIMWIEKHL